MARNGSGVYSLPAGSLVSNGDTGTASQHNTPLQDLETDMNTARPIVAGGTGATSAADARTNLGLGSMATQAASSVAITGGTITGVDMTTPPTQTVLTSGTAATYTTPSGAKAVLIEMVGGGAGGGGADGGAGSGTCALATAGGGGGYCRKFITSPAASYTYTVGAGGAGGASGNNNGSAGTASTFTDGASLSLSAGGGGAGNGDISTVSSAGTSGATGGSASGGDINIAGGATPAARIVSGDPTTTSLGGASVFGTGAVGGVNAAGADASIPGTGGGGAGTWDNASSFAGGDGADGIIIITEFY